ncbi:MAG: c-type cytochrome [Chloroflexi bacterium]|nr:c-type cytochrome [Chloroflexota bacterium]
MRKILALGLLALGLLALATGQSACGSAATLTSTIPGGPFVSVKPERQVPGGDPRLGPAAIRTYGCGSCHIIPGVPGARGKVGPPLTSMAERAFIAGQLPNTPANLIRWIQQPQAVEPGTAMPDLRVSEADVRHIAAYLYTLE